MQLARTGEVGVDRVARRHRATRDGRSSGSAAAARSRRSRTARRALPSASIAGLPRKRVCVRAGHVEEQKDDSPRAEQGGQDREGSGGEDHAGCALRFCHRASRRPQWSWLGVSKNHGPGNGVRNNAQRGDGRHRHEERAEVTGAEQHPAVPAAGRRAGAPPTRRRSPASATAARCRPHRADRSITYCCASCSISPLRGVPATIVSITVARVGVAPQGSAPEIRPPGGPPASAPGAWGSSGAAAARSSGARAAGGRHARGRRRARRHRQHGRHVGRLLGCDRMSVPFHGSGCKRRERCGGLKGGARPIADTFWPMRILVVSTLYPRWPWADTRSSAQASSSVCASSTRCWF